MKSKKYNVFESENLSRAIWTLALPTIASQLITMIYNLADTFWVGRLNDPNQVAALAIVFPMQMILTSIGNLFGVGAGTNMSVCIGAKKPKNAAYASTFAIYAGGIMTLCLSLFALFGRKALLAMLGSTDAMAEYTNTYLNWVIVIGAVPAVFNMTVANLVRSEGESSVASFGLSMGGLINIVMDPFFVLPFGLGLEVRGAAIATLISNLISTAYFIRVLIRRRNVSYISLSENIVTASKKMGRQVIMTGLPSALQTLLSAVSNLVLNGLMIDYGEVAEAAVGITKRIDGVPLGLIAGITIGATPLMAYNYGAGRYEKMKRILRLTLFYGIGAGLIILASIEFFAPYIIRIFIKDPQTVIYGARFLRLHCISIPMMSATFTLISFFQSVKANKSAFAMSCIRKGIIDIPLMIALNILLPMYGVIACQPLTDSISIISGAVLYMIWRKRFAETHTL